MAPGKGCVFFHRFPKEYSENQERTSEKKQEAQKRNQDLFSEHNSNGGCSFYLKLEFCIFLPSYVHAPQKAARFPGEPSSLRLYLKLS